MYPTPSLSQTGTVGEVSWDSDSFSLAGAALLAIFAVGAFRKGAGQKARIFGASWFLLTYLPISNLFELNATVAEHWLYLPSVGFLIFVAGIVFDLPVRFRKSAIALSCLAVVA